MYFIVLHKPLFCFSANYRPLTITHSCRSLLDGRVGGLHDELGDCM